MPSLPHSRHVRQILLASVFILGCSFFTAPLFFQAHAHQIPLDRSSPTPYHVLFDNDHAETAGNADWVISSSQPDPLGENPNPQKETDWTGGISSWGVALQKTGRYSLETSTSALTYGSTSNSLDLSHFNALVLPEPNSLFSSSEKTAILTFVHNGGGLFMIADHSGSDRNNDGADSLHVLNDLMNNSGVGNDPFGIQFDDKTISKDYPNVDPNPTDPILQGSFGSGTTSLIDDGTTETINTSDNPNVVGVIYTSGTSPAANINVFFARSSYGTGRVIAMGDSSAIDDGTCAAGNTCYNGWSDPGAQNNILFPNGTEWLASGTNSTPTTTPSPINSPTGVPVSTNTPVATPTIVGTAQPTPTASPVSSALPHFDHVVIVIEENKDYSELIGTGTGAPYINRLATQGTLFTNSHAITHPSQPNYLDLYSGSDQGKSDDSCDPSTVFPQPDLGGQLLNAGLSFAGYSESMPSAGYTDCTDSTLGIGGLYARKHNPWANFSETSGPQTNLTFDSFPSTAAGYAALPTVSFVVPSLQDDMHDGTIQQGDSWLQQHLDGYIQWAKTNNSLLIVTTDEGDTSTNNTANQIATIFVGQHVQVGSSALNINHYTVLRTLEDMYGLAPANNAATVSAITGIWN
jgi:Phosphoesterase family